MQDLATPFEAFTLGTLITRPPRTFLVDGILPETSLGVLYGLPGSGKTFLALDLAFSIANGRPWLGHSVQQGGVVYIAAEGWYSIAQRAQAWCAVYEQPLPEQLLVIPDSVQFTRGHGVRSFERFLSTITEHGLVAVNPVW
jgi:hypothetical protein